MKAVSIPISSIGHGVTVTFGHRLGLKNHEWHLEDLESPWLHPFFEEMKLSSSAERQIKLTLVLNRDGSLVRAAGEIEFSPELECVRSLTLFRQRIVAPLKGVFVDNALAQPQKTINHHANAKNQTTAEEDGLLLTQEDFDVYSYQKNMIDLDELLLDAMQTALPDRPLCHEQCKGICVECGQVLNNLKNCEQEGECPNLHFFH